MTARKTRFAPQAHGFRFLNAGFQLTFFDLIGPGSVFPNDAPVGTFGLCGGFCFAALDRFFGARPVENQTEQPARGSALFNELLQRQKDSLIPYVGKIFDWQTSPDQGHWNRSHSVGYRTKKEWPVIKTSLDRGVPITLCLIATEGYTANPTDNHQVVAYDYEESGGRIYVRVYDPDWTYDPAGTQIGGYELSVNFNLENNNIDGRYDGAWLPRLRGFFPIPYIGPQAVIAASVREARVLSCTLEGIRATTIAGRTVRQNDYKLTFEWAANFAPYYTLLVDGIATPVPGVWGDSAPSFAFRPLPASGRMDLHIATYRMTPHLVKLEVSEKHCEAQQLLPPAPIMTPELFLHSPGVNSWVTGIQALICDAAEEDVCTWGPDPTEADISLMQGRAVLVKGRAEGPVSDPEATLTGWRVVYHVGYVTMPTWCKLTYEWLVEPVAFEWFRIKVKLTNGHEIHEATGWQPLLQADLARFQVAPGFSEADCAGDFYYEVCLHATDPAGQGVYETVQLYGRSLLVFVHPQYQRLVYPEWEDLRNRIREYVDRDLLQSLITRLSDADQRVVTSHGQRFVELCLDAAKSNWRAIADEPKLRKRLLDERIARGHAEFREMAGLAAAAADHHDFSAQITRAGQRWCKNDGRLVAGVCFGGIYRWLEMKGQLGTLIQSLKRN